VNGMPAGVSLRGFLGRNRFVAVASVAPLPPESLAALFTAFPDSGQSAPSLERAHVARFDIEVLAVAAAPP